MQKKNKELEELELKLKDNEEKMQKNHQQSKEKLVVGQYSTVSAHEYERKLKRFQDMINDKDQEINCLKVQVNEAENATNRARSMLKDTNKRKPLSTETLTKESLSCPSTNEKPRQAEVEVGDDSQDLEPVSIVFFVPNDKDKTEH